MKLTNQVIGVMVDTMTSLNETGELGYAIAYNLRKMTDEAKEYIELQGELLQKYGTKTANGYSLNPIDNPEEYEKYIEEMGDIPQIEHEVELYQVSPRVFYSGNLTSRQMTNLMLMVDPDKKESYEIKREESSEKEEELKEKMDEKKEKMKEMPELPKGEIA